MLSHADGDELAQVVVEGVEFGHRVRRQPIGVGERKLDLADP